MMKILELLLKPLVAAALVTILFFVGFLIGVWKVGYWNPIYRIVAAPPSVQKMSPDRARVEVTRLQKLLMELDHRGLEFKKRTETLDEREAKIRMAENDLRLQKAALEKLTDQIAGMRKELDERLILVDANQDEGFQKMSKLYSTMTPPNAAKALALLPENQAVQIISKMKLATSVKILETWMNQGGDLTEKASRVTNLLRVAIPAPTQNNP